MLTPEGAVHFGLLHTEAFRECVQATGVLVPKEIVRGRKRDDDHEGDRYVTHTVGVWLPVFVSLLLPFSALL